MSAPVKRILATSSLLICVSVLPLTACGGKDDTSTTAGSAPAASVPAASPAGGDTAGGANDKKLCESVRTAGEKMKSSLITALQSGEEPSPAVFKKILTDLDKEVTSLAEAGGDSEVGAALQKLGSEAAKAAKASDPAEAADNPEFEKAGTEITAACKSAGVDVNF